ncbi:MAG: 50S ribosomal protein L21e [Thermoplasmatota archaeon]
MAKRSKGTRSKTRHVFRKKPRERGLSPITRALQQFEKGDRVSVVIDPSIQKGMPHRRFHGKTGYVTGRQGNSYTVDVRQGNAVKTVIARPEHLRKE